MAKPLISLPFLCLFLLFSSYSGGMLKLANGQADAQMVLQGAWCLAKPSSSEQALLENINYACGRVNCSIIKNGGPCFFPDTLLNHASVAMNLYYQKEGRHFWNCDFKNSGIISVTDPSYDNCRYAFAR